MKTSQTAPGLLHTLWLLMIRFVWTLLTNTAYCNIIVKTPTQPTVYFVTTELEVRLHSYPKVHPPTTQTLPTKHACGTKMSQNGEPSRII